MSGSPSVNTEHGETMTSPEAVSSPPVKLMKSAEAVSSPPVKPMESPEAVPSPPVKSMESPETVSSPLVTPMESPKAVSSRPVKPLLDEPRITATMDSGCRNLYSVSCLSEDQVWACGDGEIMKLLNVQGERPTSIETESGLIPEGLAVTRGGDLVYSDPDHKTVNIVKNKEIRTLIKIQGWKPQHICSTASDDLLVVMHSDDGEQWKVVRYSGSTEKQTIQFDDQARPLYSYACYISENRNLDICVADYGARAVVVVNHLGKLRFRYTGHPSNTVHLFDPHGITTDSHSHILTSDSNNDRIHILDQDGQFLRYIHDLSEPCGLSVDSRDNLFVAEFGTGKVKKIQYL